MTITFGTCNMKRVVKASASEVNRNIDRLRRYAVADNTLVNTLCYKLLDAMSSDPDITFEDAYDYYLTYVIWEDGLYPDVKSRLKELGIWINDDDTIRDVTDLYFNK